MSDHADLIFKAVEDGDPSALAASWRRSLLVHGLEPDVAPRSDGCAAATLQEIRDREHALLEVASDHLDRVFAMVSGSDHGVFLANAKGIVIDKRSGRRHEIWERRPEQWLGVDMSEEVEGTNAIGTCLADKRAVTIVGEQHFRTFHAGMICNGAPIFGPMGDLVGCLDVSRPATEAALGMEALVLAAVADIARRIELSMFMQAYPTARFVLAAPFGRDPSAVVAVDADGFLLGATRSARQLLALTAEKMDSPILAAELLSPLDGKQFDLETIERKSIENALVRHRGKVSTTARALGITRSTLYRKMTAFGLRCRADGTVARDQ